MGGTAGMAMSDDLLAFYAYPRSDRVYVRASLVQTRDGALTGQDHRSHSITRPADQRALAAMRHLADVILIGASTVRQEDFGRKPPADGTELAELTPDMAVAVVSHSLDLDPRASLFVDAVTSTIVLTTADSPADRRRELAAVAELVVADSTMVDMSWALGVLAGKGLTKVLCESGPTLLAQLVDAGLLDEVCLTTIPEDATWDAPRYQLPPGLRRSDTREEAGLLFERYVRSTSARS
jgi:riboflavin biosynthesis pyrimidine reductase